MDNKSVHISLHQKVAKTLNQIDGKGQIEEIPGYYGEILFQNEEKVQNDDSIRNACQKILGEECTEELPGFLNELLDKDPEVLIAQLLEYYTRHQLLSQNFK